MQCLCRRSAAQIQLAKVSVPKAISMALAWRARHSESQWGHGKLRVLGPLAIQRAAGVLVRGRERERERAILAQVSTPCTWGSVRLLVPGGRGGALLWAVPRRSCPCLDPVALESPAVAIALKRPLLVPTSGGAILVKGEFADLSPRARPDYCKDFAEQASVRKGTHNITNGPLDIVAELTRKYHGAGRGTRRPQCS